MKNICFSVGIAFLVMFTQCTKEEEPLTEWGQKAKDKLEELTATVTDLAWLKVYNADESELFWSGVGTPETGSPVLMWTLMERFRGEGFQRFDLEKEVAMIHVKRTIGTSAGSRFPITTSSGSSCNMFPFTRTVS